MVELKKMRRQCGMYQVTVPLYLSVINEESLPVFLEEFQKAKASRVLLCGFGTVFKETSPLHTDAEKIERTIRYFQSHGLEVGLWINCLGHGAALSHEREGAGQEFTEMEGIHGDKYGFAYCPLDPDFTEAFGKAVGKLAGLHPDLIRLDDDFRLNLRKYYFGCWCPLHLSEYYKRIGEEIPREKLEELIFTGKKNKYRSAYMELAADTLLNFARAMRKAVDAVDPTIRMSACGCFDTWDFEGTDCIEIAKAFAGDTRPFLRTIGAPYHHSELCNVIEESRNQLWWCKDSGVEVITEGDTYPRPRYNVPSKGLELFDLALLADGSADGILKYMTDYVQDVHYEMGYAERHVKNEPLRQGIKELFDGKTPIGVRVHAVMHKVENWDLGDTFQPGVAKKLIDSVKSPHKIISHNSIPTVYGDGDYPILLCGENARYITEKDLANGAILDIPAARILQEAGVDVGLVSEESGQFAEEYFRKDKDAIRNISDVALKRIVCRENAQVLSVFLPDETPAAYTYENDGGQRFLVLAYDAYDSGKNANYFNNYYRQAQLIEAIEWIGGKKLPAVSVKNPYLYMLTSSDGEVMSVALFNIFPDDILHPVICLDKEYDEIRFLNCTGTLAGDKVLLSEMGPYAVAAFEVKRSAK